MIADECLIALKMRVKESVTWFWRPASISSRKKSSATLSSPGCRARLPSVRKKRGPVRVSSRVLPAPGPGLRLLPVSRHKKCVRQKNAIRSLSTEHSHRHGDLLDRWEKHFQKISIFHSLKLFFFHWFFIDIFFQTRAWSSLMLLTGTRLRRRPSSITRTRPRPWTCTPPWSSPSSSCSSSCPSSAPSPPSTCSQAPAEVTIPRTYFELWPVTRDIPLMCW